MILPPRKCGDVRAVHQPDRRGAVVVLPEDIGLAVAIEVGAVLGVPRRTGIGERGTKVFLDTARKNLTPNRDRIHFIKDGEEFLPGVQAILAPGHTVGHTIFMITSGGNSLCYVGDLAHHPVLLLEKPLTEFMDDTDPKQSAQTRVKMLGMLAEKKIPLLAYHFAWPGIGHVAKRRE